MEALPHARRCLELDPLSIGARFGYGAALIQAGQLDQAVKYLLVLARQEPQNEVAYGFLGIAYNRLGQHRLASQMYEKAFQCSGFKNAGYEAGIAWSRALDGDKAYARLCYRKLTAQRRGGAPVPAYQLALLAITLNRLHDALDWFEAAAKDRSLSFFELATEPLLNSLNAEPRFQTVRSQFQ
jgi:Flp pilus assembly protein TadD